MVFSFTSSSISAGDGEEALRILEEKNYKVDMILLDLMMPGMNGQTFMQERKNDPRILNIPVVIITADDTTEQQVLTMELGASDYIVLFSVVWRSTKTPTTVVDLICHARH